MNRIIKIVFLFGLVISLAACSTMKRYGIFHNNSNDYRLAKTTQPLNIPPGYSSSKFKAYYVVPNPHYAAVIKPIGLIPPNINLSKVPSKKQFWQRYPWF